MKRFFLINALLALVISSVCFYGARAQQLVFTANCNGDATHDTAWFVTNKATVGAVNDATFQLPFKLNPAQRCQVNTLTLTANITLDNTNGSGISVVTGQTLTVQGPRVNPAGKTMFYNVGGGQGTAVLTGRTYLNDNDASVTNTRTPTDGSVTDAKITLGGLSPTKVTGTAVITTDSRLSDSRTPLDASVTPTKLAASVIDPAANVAGARTLGSGSQQAAAGNDSRIVGAAQKASNLADLASASTARTNLGLGDSATKAVGTTAGTIAAGDDSRFNTRCTGIDVSGAKTGGVGTAASPYTGWDTAITWTKATYCFPSGDGLHGYYAFSTSPAWAIAGIRLSGEAGTVLKFTGTGKAVQFVGSVQPSGASGPSFITFENFTILGNASATHGLYVETCHRSLFQNIKVEDVTTAAFEFHFTILNVYRRLIHSYYGSVIPAHGLVTSRRNLGEPAQGCTFEDIVMEGASGDGIVLNYLQQSRFIGGTSEGNGGDGVLINSTCLGVVIDGMDVEANTGGDDFIDNGENTILRNVLSGDRTVIGATSKFAVIDGGIFNSVTFTAGCTVPTVRGYPVFNVAGTGAITSVPGVDGQSAFHTYTTTNLSSKFLTFPTLSNSWVDNDPYLYYRKVGGRTCIEGRTSGGTVNATIFTLDVFNRPVRDHQINVSCGTAGAAVQCTIAISSIGVVKMLAGNDASGQAALYFDNVCFDSYLP